MNLSRSVGLYLSLCIMSLCLYGCTHAYERMCTSDLTGDCVSVCMRVYMHMSVARNVCLDVYTYMCSIALLVFIVIQHKSTFNACR